MIDCEYCNNKIIEIPRPCKYCKKCFCTEHRLPESHDCKDLKKGNIFLGYKASEDTFTQLNIRK